MIREIITETFPRFMVTAGVFYLNYYAFTSEAVPQEMKYALLTLLGSAVGFWLGTSQSSASKTKVIQGELQEDSVEIVPARPPSKI